eukprot:244677-Lingulodinium_polyedra.AAC.1
MAATRRNIPPRYRVPWIEFVGEIAVFGKSRVTTAGAQWGGAVLQLVFDGRTVQTDARRHVLPMFCPRL